MYFDETCYVVSERLGNNIHVNTRIRQYWIMVAEELYCFDFLLINNVMNIK